ncbi:hypothetical protein L598_002600000390 [Mesorhizobium sp. J18]|uniref:AtuA-related protein n=1 Tax=Mesorhizobium sp. J18 TaxID=935263 RepID=UPI00119A48D2|nr:hypothetical protein [Mesorhizobium sp. J18]TWG96408.1 hypothetical protein L598_002600000390 [Mesorhizobium sp. J18]
MRQTVPLRRVASARAGDKGNISNVSVWAYEARHYADIKASITPEALKAAYPAQFRGQIERFELDHLHGMNFVIHDALEGGVNTSLNLDAHGKSFSFLVLDLPVTVDL